MGPSRRARSRSALFWISKRVRRGPRPVLQDLQGDVNLVDAPKPLVGILGAGDDEAHIPEKRRADYVSEGILRKPLVDRRPGCIPRLVVSVQAEPNDKVLAGAVSDSAIAHVILHFYIHKWRTHRGCAPVSRAPVPTDPSLSRPVAVASRVQPLCPNQLVLN